MLSRRDEDDLERAKLDEWYGPDGTGPVPLFDVEGAPPPPTLAVRLNLSAPEVRERLRAAPCIVPLAISGEGKAPEFELREELLLDEEGAQPRLWIRPFVDKYEGAVKARWGSRPYSDVAVLHLEAKPSGGCELVVTWELHPKTRRYRRSLYIQAVVAAVSALGIVVLGRPDGGLMLACILMPIPSIIWVDRGRKAARNGFDAVAAVRQALAEG